MNKNPTAIHALTVRILGKDYVIACPEGEDDKLLRSANYVDEKMKIIRNSGKVMGSDRIAVMAALNIAHEMLVATSTENNETLHKLKTLEDSISAAVKRYKKA